MNTLHVPPQADRQSGVFTLAQARSAGFSHHDISISRHETWQPMGGSSYAGPDSQIGPLQRAWAAGLWRPDAVVVLHSAAALHGLPYLDDNLGHAWLSTRTRAPRGLKTHTFPLPAEHVQVRGALQVTTLERTAIDLMAGPDKELRENVMSWVISRQLVGLPAIEAALAARKGTPGVKRLDKTWKYFKAGAASELEYRGHRLLHRANIQGWRPNQPIYDGPIIRFSADVLFKRERLVITFDGARFHDSDHDKAETAALQCLGYKVLRLTWWDVTKGRHQTIDRIRTALAACRADAT